MGYEGRKGKFEVDISAAVRGCERSRRRMVEGIIFLQEFRYVWCWFLFWPSRMFCRQMSWLRGMKKEKSDDVRYGSPLTLLVLALTWSLALQSPVRHAQ